MRKPLFSVLVGSQSVNLATPESDYDYVHFYVPTFEELCLKQEVTALQETSDKEDNTSYDIRRLIDLANKPNITNLSIFYTDKLKMYPTGHMGRDVALNALINEIFSYRHQIASFNPHGLYEACMGMYKRDRQNFEKHPDIMKYAANAYRDLDFILRYDKFNDAGDALHYEWNELSRRTIVDIKTNRYDYDECIAMLNRLFELAQSKKEMFCECKETPTFKEHLPLLIEEVIRIAGSVNG